MKQIILASLLASVALTSHAQEQVEIGSEAFGEAVREYLMANPEVILEAVELYNKNQEAKAQEDARAAVVDNRDRIFDAKDTIILGNPEGTLAIVEFIDYNCGYCHKAHEELSEILANNPDVKIQIRQFPILSQGSLEASKVVHAVHDLYDNETALKLHNALFDSGEKNDLSTAMAQAEALGLDRAKIEEALEGQDVYDALADVHDLAELLDLSGTPGFIIGDEILRGYIPKDQFQAIINEIKAQS